VQNVELVNDAGKQVTGTLSADGLSWTNSEPLGYGRTYTLSATATNAAGKTTVKKASYTTLTPPNMTMPYFQYTGGYTLQNGATYGVGIVPIVHWDEPIADRDAALDTISITTTPHVAGAWYWADSQNVAFRPASRGGTNLYWPAGTKVTIAVKDYGKQVSPGLYGQADTKISFKIGAKHVTIATDNAPKSVNTVVVYFNNKKVNAFHTSMGEHSSVTYSGRTISFWTMQGTYTVLEHDNPAIMSSESYGLPANSPQGYGPEPIYWATKISTDGIYLHELTTTIWAQESGRDVSHGCLNLSTANATWFYKHSIPGDVVVIRNPGAPQITYAQGGAWSVPWKVWVAGGRAVA
jgi:lipoprotein-anchoring transpeptidase ErfK/SrfK